VLQRLVDSGNTVVVVEHNLDVAQAADWVLDLGPEGGAAGGKLIAQGTPEQIAETADSYTGQCLRELARRQASSALPFGGALAESPAQ
jgi:excinuclease ABC subunit A